MKHIRKLFQIEWDKVLPYRVFQILGIIYVASFLVSVIVLPFIKLETNISPDNDILDIPSFYTFPVIWDTYSWIASKSNLFLAVIVIFIVGNEYSYRTFRQHVIDGLSRDDLLNGKVIGIITIALANTCLIFICGIIFGFIYSTDYDFYDIFSRLYLVGVYFIQAVAYMMLALFIAIWLRNKTLSIVVLLVFSLIIEPIVRLVLRKYVWAKIGLFFPVKAITRLTPIPENGLVSFIKANAEISGLTHSLPLYAGILVVLGYTLLFYLGSRRIIRIRDL
jgi:ABC-type transport system involved in multi-copper enzyme maturation permease subunit